jgi:hypothetical protein
MATLKRLKACLKTTLKRLKACLKTTLKRLKAYLKAYRATLVAMTTIMHFVASIVTVILYVLFTSLSGESLHPIWWAPVFGSLATYLLFAFIALFCCDIIASAENANSRSYGLLQTRIVQLETRLNGIQTYQTCLKMEYRKIALQEAKDCLEHVKQYIQDHPTGMQWVTGMGYINAWNRVHKCEEALIKVEPAEMILQGAMRDMLSIKNSTISTRDELVQKIVEAVSCIEPAGTPYFREHQMIQRSNVSPHTVNKQETAHIGLPSQIDIARHPIRWLVYSLIYLKIAPHEVSGSDSERTSNASENAHKGYDAPGHASARVALSEARRTLNDFRDGLWEGLVRERNQLLLVTAVTALVTHLLLSIVILIAKPVPSVILGVIAFYMVGAVAGLFGILYNESNKSGGFIDDYGLSQARLIAAPLLSGLAGIGGVLITIILYTTLIPPAGNISTNIVVPLEKIFRPDEPSYLLTAAVFGLTPNLIIGALRQRSQRYVSDLQKSKGSGRDSDED